MYACRFKKKLLFLAHSSWFNFTSELVTKSRHLHGLLWVALIILTVFCPYTSKKLPWRGSLNCSPPAKADMVSRLISRVQYSGAGPLEMLRGHILGTTGGKIVPYDSGNLHSDVDSEYSHGCLCLSYPLRWIQQNKIIIIIIIIVQIRPWTCALTNDHIIPMIPNSEGNLIVNL